MLLTNGWTLTSGLTFTTSSAPVPPFSPLATLDPATASTELTLVGQTVTINTNTSGWAAICSTDGAWPLPTSTANPLSFSLELVLNANGGSGGWFFMGAVPPTVYSNNTLQLGFVGPGGYFGYLESGNAAGYGYTDGAGFAFLQSGGNFIPIHAGDVLGMSVEISATSLGVMDTTWYLNGNTAGTGYPFSFGVGTTGSITPFVAYSSVSGSPSVTLRTNPATFSYANSYTNQNGWPLAPVVPPAGGNLVMTFNTSIANTVHLPLGGYGGTVNALINWGDGYTTLATSANIYTHTYASNTASYPVVVITGTMSAYGYPFSSGENSPLVSVDSWDNDLGITDLFAAFYGATHLTQVPTTLPNTVQLLNSAFSGASIFNQDLTGWDTTNVTGWDQVFNGATSFNGNISTWNTSQAVSMTAFFYNCSQFNGNISSWNVANVATMRLMFAGAQVFNQDISSWNTANVNDMLGVFNRTEAFNQDISSWNTANVTDMGSMFGLAQVFNQDISSWNTANVTNMGFMFNSASTFNQDISSWNVDKVDNMRSMFSFAYAFNQDISSWNVANVTNMNEMFAVTDAFNGNISSWNTANVTDMGSMFGRAQVFNQDISSWNTANVTNMGSMFKNATTFNQDLSGWDVANVTTYTDFASGATAWQANYQPNFPS